MIALNAHFDCKVLVPDEPLSLALNERVRITSEKVEEVKPFAAPAGKRLLGQQPGVVTYIAPDFNDPLPDSFWLGEEETNSADSNPTGNNTGNPK